MATLLPANRKDEKAAPSLVPVNLFSRLSGVQWCDLRRLEGSPRFELILPSGESFVLEVPGLLFTLKHLQVSDPESVLDYAHNFKETTLNMQTGVIACTYERNRRIGGKNVKAPTG